MEHFGYPELNLTEKTEDDPEDMVFFAGVMKDNKVSAKYLLLWIIRSVLFQESGEAFLAGRPYWEVQVDDDQTATGQD